MTSELTDDGLSDLGDLIQFLKEAVAAGHLSKKQFLAWMNLMTSAESLTRLELGLVLGQALQVVVASNRMVERAKRRVLRLEERLQQCISPDAVGKAIEVN